MLTKSLATLTVAAALFSAAPNAHARDTKCKLHYTLSSWSLVYKHSEGTGVVSCDNGQRMPVKIKTRGGGLTAGHSRIDDGFGEFSPVHNIHDVLGGYATAEANAAAGRAVKGQVVTKGPISLALSGRGKGWELGVAFGSFIISR